MAAPAINTATTLRLPSNPARVAGRPKMPLPIIEFTASAARLQRPMARTKLAGPEPVCFDVIANRFYHTRPVLWVKLLHCFLSVVRGTIEFGLKERTYFVPASISDIRLLLKVKSLPKSADSRRVFITGGTGYIGGSLIPLLLERGHRMRALVRPGSKAQLPAECEVVSGNALEADTYRKLIRPADTFIQLVGVPHPSPAKVAQFRAIDLVSGREAIQACAELGLQHFIYLSVAHPAPMMKIGRRAARARL